MLRRNSLLLLAAMLLSMSIGCDRGAKDPKLVVTIVIDGLSTDQLSRHEGCLGEGGLARLIHDGAWMREARFAHTTTFTGPGHATAATGTSPKTHGVVGNSWYDRRTEKRVYCVRDEDHAQLGEPKGKFGAISPRNLHVPTLGDILYAVTEGKSRTLSVSTKDRSAVLGAGQNGTAYSYDKRTGHFVTSTYYMDSYPEWWSEYYSTNPQDEWFGADLDVMPCADLPWFASHEASLELVGEHDPRLNPPSVIDGGESKPGPDYYKRLRWTSYMDEATLDFTVRALRGEKLGQGDTIDHLFLSLSALDYAEHAYGPDSPRATAVILGMDAQLAAFFATLDEVVGVDRWLLAFTADHGYPSTPEVCQVRGQDAGRLDPEAFVAVVEEAIEHRYGRGPWVMGWAVPTIYLDQGRIAERGLDLAQVQRIAAEALEIQPGIAEAITRPEILSGDLVSDFADAVVATYNESRSGDLLILQAPNWYLLYNPNEDACTHGSPYDYDRRVPLIFLGPQVQPRLSDAPAAVRDLVPTLLRLLNLEVPEHVEGVALEELVSR